MDGFLYGELSSGDLAQAFAAGKYEGAWVDQWGELHNGARWSEGDWNGDGVLDRGDFVTAFQDGGYEQVAAA